MHVQWHGKMEFKFHSSFSFFTFVWHWETVIKKQEKYLPFRLRLSLCSLSGLVMQPRPRKFLCHSKKNIKKCLLLRLSSYALFRSCGIEVFY